MKKKILYYAIQFVVAVLTALGTSITVTSCM